MTITNTNKYNNPTNRTFLFYGLYDRNKYTFPSSSKLNKIIPVLVFYFEYMC